MITARYYIYVIHLFTVDNILVNGKIIITTTILIMRIIIVIIKTPHNADGHSKRILEIN